MDWEWFSPASEGISDARAKKGVRQITSSDAHRFISLGETSADTSGVRCIRTHVRPPTPTQLSLPLFSGVHWRPNVTRPRKAPYRERTGRSRQLPAVCATRAGSLAPVPACLPCLRRDHRLPCTGYDERNGARWTRRVVRTERTSRMCRNVSALGAMTLGERLRSPSTRSSDRR